MVVVVVLLRFDVDLDWKGDECNCKCKRGAENIPLVDKHLSLNTNFSDRHLKHRFRQVLKPCITEVIFKLVNQNNDSAVVDFITV